ncbi:integral peroxisomal membrane peroxin-domain-containing protein [Irpex rosettiformis]|uniref:Integral peroxisomal membrane peroxin-domain-containing protein n=1 Tax=Irpex rosettiformis TaxID=378272 RepID=A0ACB8U119_9APHY|nr:integral peroxisomal membrane peroxin-domain-containing protein [Irpex rosettiformis]
MATFDYVDVPTAATRLQSRERSTDLRPAMKIVTALPHPEKVSRSTTLTPTEPMSPSKTPTINFSQVLLSSAIPLPANAPATPRDTKGTLKLLSTKDPLSIPITTVNFKRFVSRAGPVFWLQDRLEEIVMWRKGWKYTTVWVTGYAFLCYFPRLALLLPVYLLLGSLLANNPSIKRDVPEAPKGNRVPPLPTAPASEWSTDWLSNVQAIQNLMGAFSDAYDLVYPTIPHLNYQSPFTPLVLTVVAILSIILVPLVQLVPLRVTFLFLGIFPFLLTHPFTRFTLLPFAMQLAQPYFKVARARLTRLVDNDHLEDKHWRSELKEVYLWENERWAGISGVDENVLSEASWSKNNLRLGERKAWTRGRDGWSGVAEDGSGDVSSNLTFSLSSGWLFVETEDWRPDLEGAWIAPTEADEILDGWVYTNDSWMDPRPTPLEEWKLANGLTRRRRWMRRIYYDPTFAS